MTTFANHCAPAAGAPHTTKATRPAILSAALGAVRRGAAVLAFIDLTRRRFEQGLHEEPLRLQLPKEFQALPGTPHLVPFRLDPPVLSPQPTLTGSTEP